MNLFLNPLCKFGSHHILSIPLWTNNLPALSQCHSLTFLLKFYFWTSPMLTFWCYKPCNRFPNFLHITNRILDLDILLDAFPPPLLSLSFAFLVRFHLKFHNSPKQIFSLLKCAFWGLCCHSVCHSNIYWLTNQLGALKFRLKAHIYV
jgi:hypothetical protein